MKSLVIGLPEEDFDWLTYTWEAMAQDVLDKDELGQRGTGRSVLFRAICVAGIVNYDETVQLLKKIKKLAKREDDMKIEAIKVVFSHDGMWGNVDPEAEGYDVEASHEKFSEMVCNMLEADYPNAEVEVCVGLGDKYLSYSEALGWEDDDSIAQDVSKIWHDFDWVVEIA